MQQLCTTFSFAIFALLCSHTYTHAMEKPIDETRVPSLKNICLHYIGTHIHEVNVIPNLSHVPIDLANDIILSTSLALIGKHKDTLTALIHKKELDHTVLSSIACRLCDFKTTLNKQMLTRLSEIEHITTGLNNATIDPVMLAEFSKMLHASPTKPILALKKELIVFNELAITIHTNQSNNKNLDNNRDLFKKLSIQTNECIKRINTLQEYASTICIKTLTHNLAKNGTLTCDLAKKMCTDFMNTDIPDSFDDLFNHYFPESIVTNDNNISLHVALTSLLSIKPIKSSTPFPTQEFEKQREAMITPTETSPWIDITYNTPKKYTRTIPSTFIRLASSKNEIQTVFINPACNILLVHSKDNDPTNSMDFVYLTNTKSLISLLCAIKEIKQIGLNSDCTQLGIIHKDSSISTYILPNELVTFAPSLKQRAFLAYFNYKVWSQLATELVDWERAQDFSIAAKFFKQHTNIPVLTLDKFLGSLTQNNKYLIPESLYEVIYSKRIDRLAELLGLFVMFKLTSKKLNLTLESLCDKIISHEITTEFLLEIFDEIKSSMSPLTSKEQREKMLAEFGQQK